MVYTENTTTYSGTDDEEIEATYIPFGYERVEVNVGDEGITSFSWINRMQGEILQENVEMISFEKVQSIIEEQIMMKHADTKDIEVRQKVVSVDLGLMCVRKPNDNSSFTMVPIWDVYAIWEEGEHRIRSVGGRVAYNQCDRRKHYQPRIPVLEAGYIEREAK